MKKLIFENVLEASDRIKGYIKNTPIIFDEKLNAQLGAQIFFKMENRQKTKSFKIRGALNAILAYQEKYGRLPEKVVVQSSGNHAQGMAYICKKFGIPVLVYMMSNASPIKISATRSFGAEVVLLGSRSEVNLAAEQKQKEGYLFVHPSDNDHVIAAQGTVALEALKEIGEVDAIFAPCGGGGLIAGSFLVAQKLSPQSKVFACEPLNGNDIAISFHQGKIFGFDEAPSTIADGARTLRVSERCFSYIKHISNVLEIAESEISFWQRKILEILNEEIEITSALAVAGLKQFLDKSSFTNNQKFLVIISGGNVS